MHTECTDPSEFWRLVEQHRPSVYGLIMLFVGDRGRAEDILQDVWLTALEKWNAYESGTDFGAWVRSIARFKVKEYFRERGRNLTLLDPGLIDDISDHPAITEVFSSAERDAVEACISALPEKTREIIRLRYEDGCSGQEIADRIGWKVPSIYVALTRAKAAIRECVQIKLDADKGSE